MSGFTEETAASRDRGRLLWITRAALLLLAMSPLVWTQTSWAQEDPVPEGSGDALAQQEDPDALPTVDEVMDLLNDLWRSDSSYAEMTMEVSTENYDRTMNMESWSRGEDQALIIIRSPAREAGTATLRTDEGLWTYSPRADRMVRIPSGLLGDSWMGSHFTNDDLMRETDWVDDFDTEISWIEEEGQRLLLSVSIPHEDAPVVWSRIEFRLVADIWTPLRSDYYDGDELIRSMIFSNIQEIQGRPVPMSMEVIPHTSPGEYTRVTYESLEFDVDVDDDTFTQRNLRREAQRR